VVALLCLLQAVVGGGIVAGASTGSAGVQMAQETATPTNNSSVQQENPDDVSEDGDTEAVRSYLAQSLAEQLGESAVSISQAEYERGQSLLGDEYDSTLEKYVDVEGETGGSEEFEAAAENQRELGNTAQEYNETYQEYQEAREAGNTTRARELARELDRLAGDANESARRLMESYAGIENATGADLSAAEQSAMNVSQEIRERHDAVISETLVRTTLSVRTDDPTASFADPASVRGQITLANGTTLDNETVVVQIGEQLETVRTDADGAFALDYRPVTIPNGTANVSVAYQPALDSVYLGSNATLNVTVEQTTATLNVATDPTSAGFGDDVTVSGRAHVDGTPVAGARVRVSVDGIALGTATTGPNGTYNVTAELPASVSSGDRSVSAVVVPEERAVRSEPAMAPLRVESTATSLSVAATRENGSRILLTGELSTDDGRPVAGQAVELRIDGSTVATVETRADGSFSQVVTPQAGLSGVVSVGAVYDEPSSNLDAATAQASVDLDPGGGGTGESDQLPLSPAVLGGGGVVVLSLLVIGWLVRRDPESPAPDQPTPSASSMTAETGSEPATSVGDDAAALLDDDESEAAIRALYAAVRRSIQAGDSAQTHWEFYASASERLNPEAAGALERLTAAYERAVYSPNPLDREAATELLDDATSLWGEDESV